MATITETEQPALFEARDIAATAELERELDRALCKQYFAGWLSAGSLSTDTVVDGITYADFRAAADRLAAVAA